MISLVQEMLTSIAGCDQENRLRDLEAPSPLACCDVLDPQEEAEMREQLIAVFDNQVSPSHFGGDRTPLVAAPGRRDFVAPHPLDFGVSRSGSLWPHTAVPSPCRALALFPPEAVPAKPRPSSPPTLPIPGSTPGPRAVSRSLYPRVELDSVPRDRHRLGSGWGEAARSPSLGHDGEWREAAVPSAQETPASLTASRCGRDPDPTPPLLGSLSGRLEAAARSTSSGTWREPETPLTPPGSAGGPDREPLRPVAGPQLSQRSMAKSLTGQERRHLQLLEDLRPSKAEPHAPPLRLSDLRGSETRRRAPREDASASPGAAASGARRSPKRYQSRAGHKRVAVASSGPDERHSAPEADGGPLQELDLGGLVEAAEEVFAQSAAAGRMSQEAAVLAVERISSKVLGEPVGLEEQWLSDAFRGADRSGVGSLDQQEFVVWVTWVLS